MNKKNRIILLAAMIVAAVSQTFAQGNGLAGINEATSMVTSYFDPGTKLIYAIGAVALETEIYLSDAIALTASVKERLVWGNSTGHFHTQFGIGMKFIIN